MYLDIYSKYCLMQYRHAVNLYVFVNGRKIWLMIEKDHIRKSGKKGRIYPKSF